MLSRAVLCLLDLLLCPPRRLAEGRSLQRKDILKLATLLIEQPWDYAYDSITRSLEAIEVLKPGQVLTGADVLTLMELCVESCGNSFSYRLVPLERRGLGWGC